MPQQVNDSYLSQLLKKYQHQDLTKRDVLNAIHHYKNLIPKIDRFVFNDGTTKDLMCLTGTIPVPFKGNTYNIPVKIWLLDTHPVNSPMCYVTPTSDMKIKVSRNVDQNGRIYLPYLHEWNPNSSDLIGLIQVMIIVFGETPPVYSKPKVQETSTGYPPYPPAASGYMPMPGVVSNPTYPPYPTAANAGPRPSFPMPLSSESSQYRPQATGYPPYPAYPPASNYPVYSTPSTVGYSSYPPVGSQPSMGYPSYPPSTVPAVTQQNASGQANTGTISEEHIRASLLSAVEDKLKKRLREVIAQTQAEIQVLKKTQDDLNNGKIKLDDIISKLEQEQVELESNVRILREKNNEMKEILSKMEDQDGVEIDDAVVTTAPLYKQLLNAFAEENATEDAIYFLGEALRKNVIDLDVFLKHVRELSRKQFMLRALMQRCRQKAGLPF
ncbi:tumor susceptibility gene 101 protein-like isoform X2 [Limulus polyphemus]|uniref:Tumor susceptibility gene 101 protein-like isoform X2 n=1 Tax=Limulus polyphemus TaxID=6850 RepID=A0ABM1BV92_LIMPO|nr:tumor susceptibility gene 101 protein-like isoform X2 [Limulus polyphemus]